MNGKIFNLEELFRSGKERLREAQIEEADLDAWYLLEFVTGITKARYYMDPDQSMDPEAWEKYKEYLEKRRNHIPLQHITGEQEFMGYPFCVNEHVLYYHAPHILPHMIFQDTLPRICGLSQMPYQDLLHLP